MKQKYLGLFWWKTPQFKLCRLEVCLRTRNCFYTFQNVMLTTGNYIRDVGATHLSKGLIANKTLTSLDICSLLIIFTFTVFTTFFNREFYWGNWILGIEQSVAIKHFLERIERWRFLSFLFILFCFVWFMTLMFPRKQNFQKSW